MKQKRILGITLGSVITVVAGWIFYKSLQEGSPNWNLLILGCGMGFLLFFNFYSGRRKR